MAAPASPTNTSARPTLTTALRQLAHGYVRKGGKQSRRKRVNRLCTVNLFCPYHVPTATVGQAFFVIFR